MKIYSNVYSIRSDFYKPLKSLEESLNYTSGIKLSIYTQQNWKVQLQETIYNCIDKFYFLYMQIVVDHLPTKQS